MPHLDRDGDVFVLQLGDGENRFHPDLLAAVGELLDEVAAAPAPRALVTAATGKFFSNGLDLDWLSANTAAVNDYTAQVHDLLARVLTFPAPTAAALQGHTFAGGAMLALAHDWRVMRADRGFFCLPEADINIPFLPGMSALIQAKLTPAAATDVMLTARRYGGEDALTADLVTTTAGEDDVLPAAIAQVAPLAGKDPATLGVIKERMYAGVVAALRDRERNRIG
ncbi:MAG TPA: enoyl-CoA hydratase-related protein [Baekduia sp.]|nr:enoyl-CoA hydratase-related protein [Baekduia sp.]